METLSFWEATVPSRPTFPSLGADTEADVAIVGGGITGITTAMLLAEAGLKVALVEARQVAGGTTGWSTGNLYVPVGPFLQNVKSARSEETMKTVARARADAIDFIESQVREKNIDCQFARRPWYFVTANGKMEKIVKNEAEALQKAGFSPVTVEEAPGLGKEVKHGFRLDGHAARFHPVKYTLALAHYAAGKGAGIYENTVAVDIQEEDGYCTVKTEKGSIKAKFAVVATHIPIGIHTVQMVAAPYRSYVVAFKLKSGTYPEAYFWDNDDEFHAITTHATFGEQPDALMVAGSHHKTGQEKDHARHFDNLEKYARDHFDVEQVTHRWSAQHYRSGDNVPYIGRSHKRKKRIFIATGFYADGLTYGTVAARILSDMVLERENPHAGAFDSTRGPNLSTVKEFVAENVNVLGQYLKDMPGGEASKFGEIKPGEGKTIQVKGEKLAAYRDESSQLHVVSAVCTHMKCIVHWNNAEKTWDCPCHGSRFMVDGSVIEGPAIFGLPKYNVDAKEETIVERPGQHDYDNPVL